MTSRLSDIDPGFLGERLRVAREGSGITQAAAAKSIDAARTTLVAIEKGQRRVRLDELQKLASLYQSSVNALLRQEAVYVDLVPQFRKLPGSGDTATENASKLLSNLAKAEVELENILGVKRNFNMPQERPILSGDVTLQAEQDASDLRHWLGISGGPIPDVASLIEMELGARVYVRKVDAKISGLFVYDEMVGPCILLNANHPKTRRNQSAAHELAHVISTRNNAEISFLNEATNSREERYANAFARALNTPRRTVIQKFKEVTAGADKLTRRHVIVLANYFGVSREALVRRLEELGQVKKGAWDWFENEGKITADHVLQVLGDKPDDESCKQDSEPTTIRINILAIEAIRRGLMSEGQIARLLDLSRLDVRRLVEESDEEGGCDSAAPTLL